MQPSREAFGFLLTDAARLLRERYEQALDSAGFEITAGEARTLAHVGRHPSTRQSTLAVSMGVEPMTLSVYLDSLEAAGLIYRTPDPSDGRAKLVAPTEAAKPILSRMAVIGRRLKSKVMTGITPKDFEKVESALAVIRANLLAAANDKAAA